MRKTSIILFIGIMLLLGQNRIATAQSGVGVNTTNPKSSFEVNGSFGQNITTITTSVTLDATQGIVLCNNGSTAITVTLPTVGGCTGRIYNIKREATSTANVTIAGTIDGTTNLILGNAGESVSLFSNGTEWKKMLNYNSSSNVSSAWTTTGNASTSPSTNFIGTTDAQSLSVKTNGTERLRVLSTGNVGIGTPTPSAALQVVGDVVTKRYLTTAASTITGASSITLDMSAGNVFTITLAGSISVGTFTITNASTNPETFIVKLVYSGTGNSITWPSSFKWSGGTPPSLTDVSGKYDIISVIFDGTNYFCSYALNF